jgi:uncharacterized protein DUF1707
VALWRLIALAVPVLLRARASWARRESGAMFAGDRDRERAARSLREHYAGGYLTLQELSHRTGRVLSARSRGELRRALSGLPHGTVSGWPVGSDYPELAARSRLLAQAALRSLVLVVCTGAYLLFSLALLLVLVATLLIHGVSTSGLLVLLGVWLVPTYLFSRMWRRQAR